MGFFDFINKKESAIDFSDEKVELLSKLIDQLGDTLIKSGFGFYVARLSEIRLSATQRDKEKFKELVVSPDLFGGAGALWEIWIEDTDLRKKFEREFCRLVDHLKDIGIKNGRVDQVRKGFKI
ncbi:hypothetical protein [Chryseolinea sp. H1M3-3]|uniref:hypothetical protein n=1 Tax=Chryseolinea sp. H1M3-3 TaxID=3034144 RepID=UPI0023ED9434|nr:hypothetical protein [Chryseolinea sp. H1M3-3]